MLLLGKEYVFLWIESIEGDCIFAETFSVFALLLAFYRGEWSESIVACAAAEIRRAIGNGQCSNAQWQGHGHAACAT